MDELVDEVMDELDIQVYMYINTTNSKSFEKYKITPIDAKIVSYFLNNVCL